MTLNSSFGYVRMCVYVCAKCEVLRKFHVAFEYNCFEDQIFLSFSFFVVASRTGRAKRFEMEVIGVKCCAWTIDMVRAMLVYWNVFLFSPCVCFFFRTTFVVVADAVRVFILETHVQHYELKSQMFIIIISTRESDQISVCCFLFLSLSLFLFGHSLAVSP